MIAFLFPGQGSQRPGFGAAWRDHPSWEVVAEAGAAAGRDVAHLLLDADADELRATRNAQLFTFVASAIVLDAVERVGVEPGILAGHSLGEYTALVASGALSFEDGVRLVSERGEAMQAAADERPGTMAAVLGLDDDDVEMACARTGEDVWVANYNGPGQVVVAGSSEGVEAAGEVARQLGAKKVLAIPVGGAFHTSYMAPARDRLRKALGEVELRDAERPVVANVDARSHLDADDWSGLLSAQLCSPVRWRQSVHTLGDLGAETLVELGPGTVLTGLGKRILPGARSRSVATPADLDQLLETIADVGTEAVSVHEGEHLFATERVVVSPASGVFQPADCLGAGSPIEAGTVVGHVNGTDVRTPFSGTVVGMLAVPGERVTTSQPIAWLRTA